MSHKAAFRTRRRVNRLLAAMCLVVTGAVAPVLVSTAPAGAVEGNATDVGITRWFGSMAVDPASGRVFIAGDDTVLAFDPSGAPLGAVASVPGARGMSFDGGYLWVTEASADSIAKIDPSTLAKVGEFATDGPVGDGIATVGGLVWFTSPKVDDDYDYVDLKALDPASGTVTTRGTQRFGGQMVEIPGSDTRLLWGDQGGAPAKLYRVDLQTNPVTFDGAIAHGVADAYRQAVATEHGTLVLAAGAPYRLDEFSTEPTAGILQATGVVYPAEYSPNGVAYSPARGGVIVGMTGATNKLFVSRRGIPVSTHEIKLPYESLRRGVAISNDASRVYAVTASEGHVRLHTYSLTTTVATVSTSSITAARTERVTVTGSGLGAIDSVTLGGVPVPFGHDGANSLVLDVSTSLPAGTHTLLLDGPFGSVSRPLDVTANGSTTVAGTIVRGDQPVSGATITLTGDAGSPRTATTGSDGTYAIADVANGDHYHLVASSDGVTIPIDDLTIEGPSAATFDIDVLDAPTRDLSWLTVQLPPGVVRRLIVDQATGRVYVAVGDHIAVFDRDGRLLGRIDEQWSVSELQIVGTTLYAMLQRAGTISIIDLPSLTVTRSVPLQRTTTGSMAVVGDLVHFVDGDDQLTYLASLDLSSGVVSAPRQTRLWIPGFSPVADRPDEFLSWEVDSSPTATRWVGDHEPPTAMATTLRNVLGGGGLDLVASAADDRVWASNGRELALSTMTSTGITYPHGEGVNHAAARSSGHGGVLAFGPSVSLQGVPTSTHLTAVAPAPRSLGIDAAGDRVFTATSDGKLVISDLAPVVNSVAPDPVLEIATNLVVVGAGLGGATTVEIDGASVPFSVVDADHVSASLPSLDVGQHLVTVETPWGTSVPRQFIVVNAAPATVSSVTPATGPATGGSTVTLSGSGFSGMTEVSFGGRATTDFTVSSDTEITVTVPAHPAGNADVVVDKGGVLSAGGPGYRYIDPTPTGPVPARSEEQWDGRSYQPFSGDFNGDGVEDIFMYQPGTGPDHLRFYRGDGTFTTRPVNVTGTYQPLAGDFNGDGTTDVLWYQPGVGADYQWDFAPDGTYVSTRRNATGRYQPFVGNFNGDDYDDIFWYQPGTGADHQWSYGPGGGYVSTRRNVTGRYSPLSGDFNGDDHDDIFWYAPGLGRDYQWNFAADGTYVSTPRTATGIYEPFSGDFDGNGYDDIFWYAPGQGRDHLWSYRSGGSYRSASVNASMDAIPVVADLTGGGVDDIFWYGPGSAPDDAVYASLIWFMSPIVR